MRYSILHILIHSISFESQDAMMCIIIFWTIWITNHLNTKLGQIIDAVMGNILILSWRRSLSHWFLYDRDVRRERVNEIFWLIWSTMSYMYILFDLLTSLNQEPTMMSFWFSTRLKVCTVTIEKYSRSLTDCMILLFNQNHKRDLELASSHQSRAKNKLEMFSGTFTSPISFSYYKGL